VEFVAVFCFSYEDVYIILKKELTIRAKEKEMRNSGRRCATRHPWLEEMRRKVWGSRPEVLESA